MKWNRTYPDFEYNTPLDFCGEWVNAIVTLSKKSERQAFAEKCKGLFINYSVPKIIIAIIATILINILTIVFSIVTMVVYYVTFPIRFFVDVLCAIFANFIYKFWG